MIPELIDDNDNFDSNREKLAKKVLISNDSRENRTPTGFQSLFVD